MLEQVLRHRERFFRELQILVAREMVRSRGGDVAAVEDEQHVVPADDVANVDGHVLHMTRNGRKQLRHSIRIEFDRARELDAVRWTLAGELFDPDLLELQLFEVYVAGCVRSLMAIRCGGRRVDRGRRLATSRDADRDGKHDEGQGGSAQQHCSPHEPPPCVWCGH